MLEGEKIEDHLREMQKNIDLLRGIDTSLARPFDWMVALVTSLPESWDIFVQTLQADYGQLKIGDNDINGKVANTVKAKIAAEGQQRESRINKEKALAA
jgi:hypothetical protein